MYKTPEKRKDNYLSFEETSYQNPETSSGVQSAFGTEHLAASGNSLGMLRLGDNIQEALYHYCSNNKTAVGENEIMSKMHTSLVLPTFTAQLCSSLYEGSYLRSNSNQILNSLFDRIYSVNEITADTK